MLVIFGTFLLISAYAVYFIYKVMHAEPPKEGQQPGSAPDRLPAGPGPASVAILRPTKALLYWLPHFHAGSLPCLITTNSHCSCRKWPTCGPFAATISPPLRATASPPRRNSRAGSRHRRTTHPGSPRHGSSRDAGPHAIVGFKRDGVQEGVYKKLRLGKYELQGSSTCTTKRSTRPVSPWCSSLPNAKCGISAAC